MQRVVKKSILINRHTNQGGFAMTKATSCGGVVIFKGKILILYKNYKNRYDGWMLPKGTVEMGEEYRERVSIPLIHQQTPWLKKYIGIL